MASYPIRNSPDMGTINQAWSKITEHGGPMRPNRYVVMIPTPPIMGGGSTAMREFAYLCESASLPGRGWVATDYRYYGPKQLMPLLTEFNQFDVSIILRDLMFEKEYFDSWFELMQPGASYDMRYKDDYSVDIKIFTMSALADPQTNLVQATYSTTLTKAWPSTMAPVNLSYGDTGYGKLDLSFSFKRAYREEIDPKPFQFEIVQDATINNEGTLLPQVVLPRG